MDPHPIEQPVELRARRRYIGTEEGTVKAGQIFRLPARVARQRIEAGLAELAAGPLNGPSETKPAEPSEKKFSGAETPGRLTGSALSAAPGSERTSISSAVGRASRRRKSSASGGPVTGNLTGIE
jgi:hypothetical protein